MEGKVLERMSDQRLISDWNERFWASGGQGFQARAEARAEHEGGVRGVHGSVDPELPLAVTGDSFGIPWRIPHEFDFGARDAREMRDALASFCGENGAHSASGSGEGHRDVDLFSRDVFCVF